ncbi:hypothetical protein M8494_31895 [Serratia ureilytica]
MVKPQKPQPKNPFSGGIQQCRSNRRRKNSNAGTALGVIADSRLAAVTFIKRHWRHWLQ